MLNTDGSIHRIEKLPLPLPLKRDVRTITSSLFPALFLKSHILAVVFYTNNPAADDSFQTPQFFRSRRDFNVHYDDGPPFITSYITHHPRIVPLFPSIKHIFQRTLEHLHIILYERLHLEAVTAHQTDDL